jgi:hypothetical protein
MEEHDLKFTFAAAALGFLAISPAFSQSVPDPHAVTAFTSVNVVPMDRERVLRNQTVIVKDGKIAAVGSSLPIPAGARVIDGRGTEWLSPGLADMHTHSDTRNDMKVYLANGVTTILNMGDASYGFMDHVLPDVNAGKSPGPYAYASLSVDGSPEYGAFVVKTPDEARAAMRMAKTNGYSFIKVYNNLSPECFQAFIDEGRALHMHVIGHGVTRVGLKKQLAAGQVMVAHSEEYFYTVFNPPGYEGNAAPDKKLIPAAIAFTRRDGAYVTADLNTYATIARQWGKPEVLRQFLNMPEVKYLDPDDRLGWRHEGYIKKTGSLDGRVAFLKVLIKDMSDAGIPLILGTDAPPIPGLVPGFSLHSDMELLQSTGMTRYQILAAATRTAGRFIVHNVEGVQPFGTVAPGMRADLVLSTKNPLDDLTTLRKPLGVMVGGAWYTQSDLQALLDSVAKEYDAASQHT